MNRPGNALSDFVTEIAAASLQQSVGIAQASKAVMQTDDIINRIARWQNRYLLPANHL